MPQDQPRPVNVPVLKTVWWHGLHRGHTKQHYIADLFLVCKLRQDMIQ